MGCRGSPVAEGLVAAGEEVGVGVAGEHDVVAVARPALPDGDDVAAAGADDDADCKRQETCGFWPQCCAHMPTRWVDELLFRPAADRGGLTQACAMRVG
jgi:hypothetical protein